MSFGSSFSSYTPQTFPRYGSPALIAPYWTDINLNGGVGTVRYTAYTTDMYNGATYINEVNRFLATTEGGNFIATSLLVAQWIDVCPFGNNQCTEVMHSTTLINYMTHFQYRATHFKA